MATTSALREEYELKPAVTAQRSVVQTPVNAAGKNSRTVFFLPKLSLSFTSTRPEACLDLRVKSGALVPTAIAIFVKQLNELQGYMSRQNVDSPSPRRQASVRQRTSKRPE